MVYRGKPSAGCENCRKAKKRCTQEPGGCSRCVKLKKICSGYRDTTQLQIHDETDAIRKRVHINKRQPPKVPRAQTPIGILTPGSISSDSTSSSDTVDLDRTDITDFDLDTLASWEPTQAPTDMGITTLIALAFPKPKPQDVATNYFFDQFTSNNHWEFMRGMSLNTAIDPCLDLAIKACGMAALDNVQSLSRGKDFARGSYVDALSMLNSALRDPKQSKKDETLIAVIMLGYFENLTCDGRPSIQSWKAHVQGATQLLKVRGKSQFKTQIGRILFRETRAQVLISCLWDDRRPPDFLMEYQAELEAQTDPENAKIVKPVDNLIRLCYEFAILRAKLRTREVSDARAAEQASELDRKFIQWQIDTTEHSERWRYTDMEVPDSDHVWDGKVHSYAGHPAPTAWNTWRGVRIMLSRTQEMLCGRFQFSESEKNEQLQYFRKIRRQMTDDICATVPVSLGHSSPAYSSSCVLITAYGTIWPLFFAGTATLERVGPGAWDILNKTRNGTAHMTSSAAAQAAWIISRLDFISQHVGLRWADGVVAVLRGDFGRFRDQSMDSGEAPAFPIGSNAERPTWIKAVENSGRGPRYLIEKPSPLSDALTDDIRSKQGPMWLGRALDNSRFSGC